MPLSRHLPCNYPTMQRLNPLTSMTPLRFRLIPAVFIHNRPTEVCWKVHTGCDEDWNRFTRDAAVSSFLHLVVIQPAWYILSSPPKSTAESNHVNSLRYLFNLAQVRALTLALSPGTGVLHRLRIRRSYSLCFHLGISGSSFFESRSVFSYVSDEATGFLWSFY